MKIEHDYKRLVTLSYLSSFDFQIATKSIFELYKRLKYWVLSGNCGAMIYGRSRVGKTSSILYCMKKFKKEFGEDFPVLIWTLTEHAASTKDKYFYASLLDAMGMATDKYSRTTALELKTRIINYMAIKASETKLKSVVLFIDEAYKLDYKEYYWLMDIYNVLHVKYNVKLTVFLFGTPKEMKAIKKEFICNDQTQILERFMLNDYEFYGISDLKEMSFCLAELDRSFIRDSLGNPDSITLAEYFFPRAYNEKNALFYNLAEDFWDAFMEIKAKHGICSKDIPMHFFIQAFIFCLSTYGVEAENHYFLSKTDIINAIEETGYGKTNN